MPYGSSNFDILYKFFIKKKRKEKEKKTFVYVV